MSDPVRLSHRRDEGPKLRPERASLRDALVTLRQVLDFKAEVNDAEAVEILGIVRSVEISVLVRQLQLVASSARDLEAREPSDTWLTADEVAEHLKHTRAWVYRQARHWPFAKRPSRKSLLISERGLRRWMEHR